MEEKLFTSSSHKYCFYELAHVRWFHVASIPPAEVSQETYLLCKWHQHNNISWPLYSVLWKLHFYFKYIYFWQHSGQYFWNKFISLDYIWLQCKSTANLAGLFDYSQHGEVFLLARDGVQYPIIFPIHSRIDPFYSRNFIFITQEITNTLLKKFEGL